MSDELARLAASLVNRFWSGDGIDRDGYISDSFYDEVVRLSNYLSENHIHLLKEEPPGFGVVIGSFRVLVQWHRGGYWLAEGVDHEISAEGISREAAVKSVWARFGEELLRGVDTSRSASLNARWSAATLLGVTEL